MNRIIINMDALKHNVETILSWVEAHGSSLTVVTKALCGHEEIIGAMHGIGINSMGDSRIRNMVSIRRAAVGAEVWYLRPAHVSAASEIVSLADVSLCTEFDTVVQLNKEARRINRIHKIVIMVELGDLREGLLPVAVPEFYRDASWLSNIEVVGIGSNMGCLSGVIPDVDHLNQLAMLHELLELKFGKKIPLVSAGTSATLPLLREVRVPHRVNHFRVGESIFLGSDLVNGGTMNGLRDDVAVLEGEVVEIKEKAGGSSSSTEHLPLFGHAVSIASTAERRCNRALVTVGHVDTSVAGLRPVCGAHRICGASSDLTAIDVGNDEESLHVGDVVRFKLDYAAFVRLMNNPYTKKVIHGASGIMWGAPIGNKMSCELSSLSESVCA